MFQIYLNIKRTQRVGLFEIAAQNGWYIPSKAKYWRETDSEQVPWGKDEKNFEKRVQQYVKLLEGKRLKSEFSMTKSTIGDNGALLEWKVNISYGFRKG